MSLAAPDGDMVECPYNKLHRMLRKRLQSHLIKCRVNYPNVELQKCPFNQTHLIPEPEFVHHTTNCPDRKLITQYKFDTPQIKTEEHEKHAPIECDEDWDDTEVNDYCPQDYLENSKVLRKPEGMQPAQRKMFVKEERKRLGNFDSDEQPTVNDKVSRIKKEEPPYSDEEQDYKPAISPPLKPPTPPPPTSCNWHGRSRERDEVHVRNRSRSPTRRRSFEYRPYSPSRRDASPDYSLDDDPYYKGTGGDNSEAHFREDDYNMANSSSPTRFAVVQRRSVPYYEYSNTSDSLLNENAPMSREYATTRSSRGQPYPRRFEGSKRDHLDYY